jgi:hypothetical protein
MVECRIDVAWHAGNLGDYEIVDAPSALWHFTDCSWPIRWGQRS